MRWRSKSSRPMVRSTRWATRSTTPSSSSSSITRRSSPTSPRWMTDSHHGGPPIMGTTARFHPHGVARRGTYRTGDGAAAPIRPAALRPAHSWPDNGNLDKARRLLWPSSRSTASRSAGRPVHPGGQRRDRIDGRAGVRLRRRTRRRLRARARHLLGRRGQGSTRASPRASAPTGARARRPLAAIRWG